MSLRITYFNSLCGIRISRDHTIPVNPSSKQLTKRELIAMLSEREPILTQNSMLAYLHPVHGAYMSIKDDTIIPLTESELKVMIKFDQVIPVESYIENLQQKIDFMNKEISKMERDKRMNQPPPLDEIDIGILYASPLFSSSTGNYSQDYTLNFEKDESDLYKLLNSFQRKIRYKIRVLTKKNLEMILLLRPRILFISTQVYASDQGPVLAFESAKKIGEASLVNLETLRHLCRKFKNTKRVVIVKGCLAEMIAQMFREAGFRYVVSIHHLHSNHTEPSSFLREFINSLINKNTIENAFTKATKGGTEDFEVKCCCAHLHTSDCSWFQKMTFGEFRISELHIRHYLNGCCGQDIFKHNMTCQNAFKYIEEFRPEDLDFYLNLDEDFKYKVCCCKPEMGEAHKALKKYNRPLEGQSQVLFTSLNRKYLQRPQNKSTIFRPLMLEKSTIGRRKEIFEIVRLCTENRFLQIVGREGIGKTHLIRRVAQYVFERRFFPKGVVYIDFNLKTDHYFLFRHIAIEMNLPIFQSKDELKAALDELKILLILDNVDKLIQKDTIDTFEFLIHNTTSPHIIIVSQDPHFLVEKYKIKKMNKIEATDLLISLVENAFSTDVIFMNWIKKPDTRRGITDVIINNLEKNQKNLGSIITPSALNSIVPHFEHQDIKKIADKINSGQRQEDRTFLNYKRVKNRLYDLLGILAYIRAGVFKLSLQVLNTQIQSSFKFEQLEKDLALKTYLHIDKNKESFIIRNELIDMIKTAGLENKREHLKEALKHTAIVSRAILQALQTKKQNKAADVRSSLLYINAGINHGIWGPLYPEESFSLVEGLEKLNLDTFLTDNEASFWYYLDEGRFSEIREWMTGPEDFGEIMLCTIGILILLGRKDETERYISRCLKLKKEPLIAPYITRIRLSEAAMAAYNMKHTRALELADKLTNASDSIEENAEVYYLLGVVKHVMLRDHEANPDKSEIIDHLTTAFTNFCGISGIGYARAALALHIVDPENATHQLTEAMELFGKYDMTHWHLRADRVLADNDYRQNKLADSLEKLKKALIPAKDIKANKQIKEIRENIEELNTEIIKKTSDHTIFLVKAFPLVEKQQRAGSLVRYPSKFRENLLEKLQECLVNVRCVIGNRNNFLQELEAGGIVLHWSSEVPSENAFVLEDNIGGSDRLEMGDLKETIGNFAQRGIQLVVLALPLSQKLGKYFHKKLGAKYVIGFDLQHQYPLSGRPIRTYRLYEDAIHRFCIEFYTALAQRIPLTESYNMACTAMNELIDEPDYAHPYQFGLDDTILLPVDPENAVSKGFIDVSPCRGSIHNIEKSETLFIGRQIEMHKVLAKLDEGVSVHLAGEHGIGLSELLKQVGYYCYTRNSYPEGVIYLDLAGKRTILEILEQFQDAGLPFGSHDSKPMESLRDLKILMLLDHCDTWVEEGAHTFKSIISILTYETSISLVIATEESVELDEYFHFYKLIVYSLDSFEMDELYGLKSEGLELSEERVHELIQDCRGNPKALIDRINKERTEENCSLTDESGHDQAPILGAREHMASNIYP